MEINSRQYLQARSGKFLSKHTPEVEEVITLNVLTARGRRFIPVGCVSEIKEICPGRCVVGVAALARVEGFY